MSKLFGEFFYEWQHKPLVVAGKAMEYYGLRDGGDDVDLVVSVKDFHGLYLLYPNKQAIAPLGDAMMKVKQFECYLRCFGLEYDDLLIGAQEQEDHFVAGLPMLLQLAAMTWVRCPDHRFRQDIMLLVKGMNLEA